MNRKPRTEAELYRWHRDTLAHIAQHGEKDRNRPPMSENEPHCGWFMRRLVPKGPYKACRIWVEAPEVDDNGDLTGPEVMRCEVDGQRRDPAREWTWLCARPITEDAYMELLAGDFRGLGISLVEPTAPKAAPHRNDDMPDEPAQPAAPAPTGRTVF